METTVSTQTNVPAMYKVAIYTALSLIAFFMLMKLFNLIVVTQLRFANVLILLFSVRYVLLRKRAAEGGRLEYLTGMTVGFLTALLAAIIFAAFIFVYLSLDHNFLEYLRQTQPFGSYLTPASGAIVTLIEGAASSMIVTFLLLHTINRDGDRG